MRLRFKLISAFLTVAVLLIVAGIWSIKGFKELGFSVQEILDENYESILAIQNMVEAVEREDSAVLLLMLGYWEHGSAQIALADSNFEAGFRIAQGNITVEGEEKSLEDLWLHYRFYKDLWERPIINTDKESNLTWYRETVHKAFLDVKSDLKELNELNSNSMYLTASHLEATAGRAIMPGLIAIIATFILTTIFSYFVSALIVSPVLKMTERVREFREGGDMLALDIHTGDEIQDLADEIRLLAKRSPPKR